jgi:hypothetical protein
MTKEELAAIRERLDAATPGNWTASGYDVITDNPQKENRVTSGFSTDDYQAARDAQLIAKAPADLRALLDEVEYMQKRIDSNNDFYQVRFNRLRKWVKEEVGPLSEEVEHRYWNIVANGSATPHEQVNYLNTLHGERLRAKYAEAEVARLKAEVERLTAEAELQSKRAAGFQLAYHSNIRCYCPSEDVCKLSQERLELVEQLAQAQRASCNVVATVEIAEPVKTEDGLSMSEVIEREAFRRGAETMREVAANHVECLAPNLKNDGKRCGICTFCEIELNKYILAIPIPEDEP